MVIEGGVTSLINDGLGNKCPKEEIYVHLEARKSELLTASIKVGDISVQKRKKASKKGNKCPR